MRGQLWKEALLGVDRDGDYFGHVQLPNMVPPPISKSNPSYMHDTHTHSDPYQNIKLLMKSLAVHAEHEVVAM